MRLFTSDAAWASRDEAVRGTLELGKQADLVVLDRDLFAIEPDTFPRGKGAGDRAERQNGLSGLNPGRAEKGVFKDEQNTGEGQGH